MGYCEVMPIPRGVVFATALEDAVTLIRTDPGGVSLAAPRPIGELPAPRTVSETTNGRDHDEGTSSVKLWGSVRARGLSGTKSSRLLTPSLT